MPAVKPAAVARRRRERRALLAALLGGTGLLVLAGGYRWWLGTPPGPTATIGGPFRLTASDGRDVDQHSFPGRYLLVYFGYTHCRDVCPTTLSALAVALDALGRRAGAIQPLFVTLDPARDSPAVLRSYLAGFSPRLLGLTGTPMEIAALAHAYRVTSMVHPMASGSYDLDHSSVLYLMDPAGRFIGPVPADAPGAEMAAILSRYLS